jgi:hypothetical protein
MKSVNQWFIKQRRRNERFVSIQEFFFSNRPYDYVSYRLRILNMQIIMRYAFFCIMIYFLYNNLTNKSFTMIVLVSMIKALLSKYWWGALEVLRAKVRHSFYAHMNHEVDRTIGFYITVSLLLALSVTFVLSLLLRTYDIANHLESPIRWYLIFSIASIFVFIILRAYHSGIYALTRIIRTPGSVISPDVFGIIVLLICLPEHHYYAWLLAIIARTTLSYFLTWHFSKRMYHFYKINPELPSFGTFKYWFTRIPFFEMMISGFSFMLIQSDILFIPFIIYLLKYGAISNQLFIVMYLIYPMFVATSAWSVLFYFDRKKIRGSDFSKMMIFYNNILSRLSPLLAIFYWALAFFAVLIFFRSAYTLEVVVSLPFFVLKAKFADFLIKRFSYRGYLDILFIYLIFFVSFAGIYLTHLDFFIGFVSSLIVVLLSIKLTEYPLFKPQPNPEMYKIPIGFYSFLLKLGRASKNYSLSVYLITVDKTINTNQTYGLLDRISSIFVGKQGEICFYNDYQFLFFTVNASYHRKDIMRHCYGLVREIKHVDIHDAKAYIKEVMNPLGFFCQLFPADIYSISQKTSVDSLLEDFRNNYPEGIIFHPQPELGSKAHPMPQHEVRSIYVAIIQYLYHSRNRLNSLYEFSCAYSNSRIEFVFALPKRQVNNKRIENWLASINLFNLLEATRNIEELPDASKVLAV